MARSYMLAHMSEGLQFVDRQIDPFGTVTTKVIETHELPYDLLRVLENLRQNGYDPKQFALNRYET